MERRKIRKEEERERERKKKELKKTFRKKDKGITKPGVSKLSIAKLIIIIIVIVTPIAIFFTYNYFVSEKQPDYSFLTEGDAVYGTWLDDNTLNSTHIITNIGLASTAEFMSMEITDNYPYDPSLYTATLTKVSHSVYAIPYDLHPNNHHEAVGDCYAEFMVAFLHNVPDLIFVLKRSGAIIYPAVLQWDYILNGTNLDSLTTDQEKYFFDPKITIDPVDRELTSSTEIHILVNLTAGYYHNIGFSEIKMTFTNSENLTFSNPKPKIGGLDSKSGQYTFTSRKRKVSTFTSMYLEFNITVNSTENFSNKDILSSGRIFFQFGGKLLQNIYPNEGFSHLKINIIGIPTEEQIEAFVYMLRMKYTNFIIETPLLFNCTV